MARDSWEYLRLFQGASIASVLTAGGEPWSSSLSSCLFWGTEPWKVQIQRSFWGAPRKGVCGVSWGPGAARHCFAGGGCRWTVAAARCVALRLRLGCGMCVGPSHAPLNLQAQVGAALVGRGLPLATCAAGRCGLPPHIAVWRKG